MRPEDQDPYAPPPRYKLRSGATMRFIVLAALLGAVAWAYVSFSSQPQSASLAPPTEQRVADSGYQVAPTPQAMPPAASTQDPAATSAPARRYSSPSSSNSQDPTARQ